MKKTWAGIIGYEGMSTGDGRFIEPGALMWATLPMPLRFTSEDVGAHDGAVVSGNIEQIKRLKPQADGSVPIWASGSFDIEGKHGKEAARLVEKKLQNGISMDLDDVSFEVRTLEMSNGELGQDEMMVTTKARVRAATLVAIPAFEGARIYMLDEKAGAKLAAKKPIAFTRRQVPARRARARVDGLAFLKAKTSTFAGVDEGGRWHATFPRVGNRWIDMPSTAAEKVIAAVKNIEATSIASRDLREKALVLDEAMRTGSEAQNPLDEVRKSLEVVEMTDAAIKAAPDEIANLVEVLDAVQRKIDSGGFVDSDDIDAGGFDGADFDEPEVEAPAEDPASMILAELEADIASMKERGALDEDDVLYQIETIRDEAAAGNFDAAIKRAERSGNTSYVKGLEAARDASTSTEPIAGMTADESFPDDWEMIQDGVWEAKVGGGGVERVDDGYEASHYEDGAKVVDGTYPTLQEAIDAARAGVADRNSREESAGSVNPADGENLDDWKDQPWFETARAEAAEAGYTETAEGFEGPNGEFVVPMWPGDWYEGDREFLWDANMGQAETINEAVNGYGDEVDAEAEAARLGVSVGQILELLDMAQENRAVLEKEGATESALRFWDDVDGGMAMGDALTRAFQNPEMDVPESWPGEVPNGWTAGEPVDGEYPYIMADGDGSEMGPYGEAGMIAWDGEKYFLPGASDGVGGPYNTVEEAIEDLEANFRLDDENPFADMELPDGWQIGDSVEGEDPYIQFIDDDPDEFPMGRYGELGMIAFDEESETFYIPGASEMLQGPYDTLEEAVEVVRNNETGADEEMSVADELVADLGDRGIELTPEQAADAIAFYGDPEAALTEILENGGYGGGPASDAPKNARAANDKADRNSPAGLASELGQALTEIGEASSLNQRERMLEYGDIVSNIAADLDAGTIEPHIALLAFEMADDKLGGMGMNDNTSFLRNKLREGLEAQIDWDAVGETPSDEDLKKAAGIAGIDPDTIDPDFFASKVQAFKSKKGNWVEQTGGLPKYIREIADALMERNGWPQGRAIATAVNTVKRWAKGGKVTSDPDSPRVSAGTIAKAAAAVAEWEAKRVEAKANAAKSARYTAKPAAKQSKDYQPEERSLVASGAKRALAAPIAPPAKWFENPRLSGPTPLTVDKDGRVYGHLATWDVCHLAMPNGASECVMAPRSTTNYAMFHLGVVETAEGTHVPVGRITMRTTHAGDNWNARKAIAHYENTGLAVADVSAGEDSYGIWIAGALRPDATPEQVRALRASPLSGDWRRHPNGNLELVMGLAVNMPGFPVPRPKGLVASGALQSLVAAGMVAPKRVEKAKVEEAKADPHSLAADDLKYLRKLAERERQIEAETLKMRVLQTAVKPKIDAFAAKLREQKAKNEEES